MTHTDIEIEEGGRVEDLIIPVEINGNISEVREGSGKKCAK